MIFVRVHTAKIRKENVIICFPVPFLWFIRLFSSDVLDIPFDQCVCFLIFLVVMEVGETHLFYKAPQLSFHI